MSRCLNYYRRILLTEFHSSIQIQVDNDTPVPVAHDGRGLQIHVTPSFVTRTFFEGVYIHGTCSKGDGLRFKPFFSLKNSGTLDN